MTLLSVPIVDIAPYWTGGDAGKARGRSGSRSGLPRHRLSDHLGPRHSRRDGGGDASARARLLRFAARRENAGRTARAQRLARLYTARKRGGGALPRCGVDRGRSERILHGETGEPGRSDLRYRRRGGTAFCRQSVAGTDPQSDEGFAAPARPHLSVYLPQSGCDRTDTSSAEVGSSQTRNSGCAANARAIEIRCR